eukprot:1263928-Rhodomonas_salina.1
MACVHGASMCVHAVCVRVCVHACVHDSMIAWTETLRRSEERSPVQQWRVYTERPCVCACCVCVCVYLEEILRRRAKPSTQTLCLTRSPANNAPPAPEQDLGFK